jgi:hypothetical protein
MILLGCDKIHMHWYQTLLYLFSLFLLGVDDLASCTVKDDDFRAYDPKVGTHGQQLHPWASMALSVIVSLSRLATAVASARAGVTGLLRPTRAAGITELLGLLAIRAASTAVGIASHL